jgi:hypothetical protein
MKCCEILNINFKLIIRQDGKNNSKSTFKSPRTILSHNPYNSRSADQQFTSAATTPGGFSALWLQFRPQRVPRVVDTGQSNGTGVWKDMLVTLEV